MKNTAKAMRTGLTSFIYMFCSVLLFACQTSSTPTGDLEEKVDAYMQAHVQQKTFMGSLLIAQGGKILFKKGYGMANMEHQIAHTPQSKFRLGSISKQFAATAIMQLQEESLLSVHDPIKKYLSDYPHGETITIHHLLTHTSGIPSFTSFPEYRKMMVKSLSLDEIIATFKDKPLEFQPGEKHKYSNSGYILLGYIIEKTSGLAYADYLQKNILKPLGMASSGYDYNHIILPRRASGYAQAKGEFINASYIDMKIPHAAGALYSTVEDLYIWDRALYTEKILSSKSLEQMFTPFKDNYAYGWNVRELFDHKIIWHGGGINGFVTYFARFPEDDACIIALCNLEGSQMRKISRDLPAILFGEPYEMPTGKNDN